MKRLFVFIALSLYSISAFAQYDCVVKLLSPEGAYNGGGYASFSDDKCSVLFRRNSSELLDLTVENKTDDRLYIEWENARIDGEGIIFGADTRLSSHYTKADEVVFSGETSSHHGGLLADVWVTSEHIINPFTDEFLKKYGEKRTTLIIPVRFEDGTRNDYKFKVLTYIYHPVDYSQITIGMPTPKVKRLLGKPDAAVKEGKTLTWRYGGCVNIIFASNPAGDTFSKVINICPVSLE